jgi:hypothetical protein
MIEKWRLRIGPLDFSLLSPVDQVLTFCGHKTAYLAD